MKNIQKIKPGPGQESVWDYPRPPKLEVFKGHLRIVFNGEVIADSNRAFRILETSHPPTYYIPVSDFKEGTLSKTAKHSFCEFKGMAAYYDVSWGGKIAKNAAWGYPDVNPAYKELQDTVSVYAHMMDSCYVNDELVQAQEGDFYGGWITSNIVGPFKGAPGTWGW
ncbi:MAG: DUF427 domain-containing protein [Cyclobacteriaceae bacterium]